MAITKVNVTVFNAGLCLDAIKAYIDLTSGDPKFDNEREKARIAVEYLETVMGSPSASAKTQIAACAADMLWIT